MGSKAVPGLLPQRDGSGVGVAQSGETYLCEGQENEGKVFEKERGTEAESLREIAWVCVYFNILGRLFA